MTNDEKIEKLEALLTRAYDLLEYATFHDGRYNQASNMERFQTPAYHLCIAINLLLEADDE